MDTVIRRAAVVVALAATAGCTVHNTEAPTVGGPSTFATSFTVNAIPDAISQDGGSQSSVKVLVIGPDGKGVSGVPLRVDMSVGGVVQDFGTLSARTIVTNPDGVATVVYTAPPSPASGLFGTCANLPGTCVSIVATPTGTNFQTAVSQTVTIRLVPIGVILPPAGSPTAAFVASPTPAQMNVPVTFDASSSTPGVGASKITSYTWSFGDGGQGTGATVTHTFTALQSFNVTLTVVNDRGLSAATSQLIAVGALLVPSPKFVFSPTTPQVGQTVLFNADQSTAAPSHTLTAFNWDFGDGATGNGVTVSHAFTAVGTFNVLLGVIDDTGQKGTTTLAVTVAPGGGGGGATVAKFTFSPATPNATQSVFFNASTSTASTGHTLVTYAWDFGDGNTGLGVSVSHAFTVAGAYTVTLVVTDDIGQKGTIATPILVAVAGASSLTADFTLSPTDPVSGQLMTFNANTSSPVALITSYDWDFGDGTIILGPPCPVPPAVSLCFVINHTYFTVTGNTFTIRLTVHDSTGRTASAAHTVRVTGGAVAVASFTVTPSPAAVGAPVTFNGSSSTPAGSALVLYTWDFGDGSPLVSTPTATTTHSYAAAKTYVIRLVVTDNNGVTASTTRTLVVQ